MKTPFIVVSILFLSFLPLSNAYCQSDSVTQVVPENIFSILEQYDPLNVVIEASMKKLRKDRKDEKWQPGNLYIMMGDSVAYSQKVMVASRGKMRKKTCDVPPIKIRFFTDKPENDSLADINELKLVVNCRNAMLDEQLVRREHLAYELYNIFTDESFRTKSANVVMREAGKKRNSLQTTAFFIESQREMAARLGGKALKSRIFSPRVCDSLAYTRMSVFQFMIGNTDWGAYTRHNVKVIAYRNRRIVVIPYDFDYSGLVDADYAVPSKDSKIDDVKERYFLGLCHSDSLYDKVFDEFRLQKTAVMALCKDYPGFNLESRKHVENYIEEFYTIIKDPVRRRREIQEHCNKRIRKKKK